MVKLFSQVVLYTTSPNAPISRRSSSQSYWTGQEANRAMPSSTSCPSPRCRVRSFNLTSPASPSSVSQHYHLLPVDTHLESRQADRWTGKQMGDGRRTYRWTDKRMGDGRRTDRWTGKQMSDGRQADRWTGKQMGDGRQADRWTDKQMGDGRQADRKDGCTCMDTLSLFLPCSLCCG